MEEDTKRCYKKGRGKEGMKDGRVEAEEKRI